MTTLKRIAAYQTTDGQTFDDKDVAKKHQAELDRMAKVKELVAKGMGAIDMAEGDDLYAVIANLIVSNADALREILPKKAKSVKAEEPAKPQADENNAGAPANEQKPLNAIGELAAATEGAPQAPVVGGVTVPGADPAEAKAAPEQATQQAEPFAWPAGLSAALNTTQAAA